MNTLSRANGDGAKNKFTETPPSLELCVKLALFSLCVT